MLQSVQIFAIFQGPQFSTLEEQHMSYRTRSTLYFSVPLADLHLGLSCTQNKFTS